MSPALERYTVHIYIQHSCFPESAIDLICNLLKIICMPIVYFKLSPKT